MSDSSILWSIWEMVPPWTTWIKSVLGLTAFAASSSLIMLYVFQREIIYPSRFPPGSRDAVSSPSENGFESDSWENVWLTTPDGLKIQVFAIKGKPEEEVEPTEDSEESESSTNLRNPTNFSKLPNNVTKFSPYTILYFHANAGNMGHRLPISRILRQLLGCNIVMLSYRGYGTSEGKASEEGMRIDAQTVMDWIENHKVLSQTKLILFAQSIGGAVAIDTASRRENWGRIQGLILENTFLSLPKLIPHVMPIIDKLGLTFMLKDHWNSEKAIQHIPINVPICFLSGSVDELVPPSHMQHLYTVSRYRRDVQGHQVRLQDTWWFPFARGTHNDTVAQAGFFEAIKQFWDTMITKKIPEPEPEASAEMQEVGQDKDE